MADYGVYAKPKGPDAFNISQGPQPTPTGVDLSQTGNLSNLTCAHQMIFLYPFISPRRS